MKSCVSSACETVEKLVRELRGVVHILKRVGPRTEPWGTPQVRWDEGEIWGRIAIADVRDVKYEVNNWREREECQTVK